jgi:HEAT repeat protein
VAPLVAALDDPAWQVRLKAVRSLGILRAVAATERVGLLMEHPVSNLRKECAAALGEIAAMTGRPFLERHRDDIDPEVRKTIGWALSRLD